MASDVSMSDASPVAKQQQPQPLSKTVWTRQHWLFLDELLQLRRQGPYHTNYERCSDKYLGKTVKSQGESMTLERWHLDCVDAFKAEVGGWDEAYFMHCEDLDWCMRFWQAHWRFDELSFGGDTNLYRSNIDCIAIVGYTPTHAHIITYPFLQNTVI